jgi:branched-chain amino acid transport system substrate-binding protein
MKRTLAFSMFIVLLSAGCGGDDSELTTGGQTGSRDCTWTIGVMGALSGDYASLGVPISQGIDVAIREANEEGDLPCELDIQKEDSQGSPDQAPALAQKLVEADTMVACVCPFFSGETLATGQIFSEAGVLFSGTGTNPTIDEQGFSTFFRAIAPDNVVGEIAGRYITGAFDPGSVAIVHDNQDYSKGLAEVVQKTIGGDVAAGPFVINPEETDYSAVVAEIKDAAPDVIFYGGYTPQGGPLARQLEEAGVSVPFVSGDGLKDPTFGKLAGPAASRGAVVCPCADPNEVEGAGKFLELYREEFNEPPGVYGADTYDITTLVIEALAQLDGDEPIEEVRSHVVDYFNRLEDGDGVVKSYSWNEDGEFVADPLEAVWIYEWSEKDGDFVSLGPAKDILEEG